MTFSTHGNGHGLDDLYIMPDSEQEANLVLDYLTGLRKSGRLSSYIVCSKKFIEIPFGESFKSEIEELIKQAELLEKDKEVNKIVVKKED